MKFRCKLLNCAIWRKYLWYFTYMYIMLIAWTKPWNGFPKYENVKDRNHAYKLTELWAKLKTFKNLQKPSRDCTHKVYVYLSYFTWTQFFIESDPTIWGKNDLTISTILWNSRDHLGLKWIWPRLFSTDFENWYKNWWCDYSIFFP